MVTKDDSETEKERERERERHYNDESREGYKERDIEANGAREKEVD